MRELNKILEKNGERKEMKHFRLSQTKAKNYIKLEKRLRRKGE